MKILADENIARVADYFAWEGELITMPGRAITASVLEDVDALLVRSITRVDEALLANSRCSFVGTATSGMDHIDAAWLRQRNIGFGWARGCNANSVVEYVFSAMARLSATHDFDWRGRSYGIIGCGEIGSLLARKLQSLGIPFVIHDPFLDTDHPLAKHFVSLDVALSQEVLTFHTPLTEEGSWPTWHMLNTERLANIPPSTILINAARGAVVDNAALLARLRQFPRQLVVLDAWEGEPEINHELLQRVALGTPHIAGYSREGKINGTRMIAASFCEHFGLQPASPLLLSEGDSGINLSVDSSLSVREQLNQLVLQSYDVARDHMAMQALLTTETPGLLFDNLRKHYPERREFSHFTIRASALSSETAEQARYLGFQLPA